MKTSETYRNNLLTLLVLLAFWNGYRYFRGDFNQQVPEFKSFPHLRIDAVEPIELPQV